MKEKMVFRLFSDVQIMDDCQMYQSVEFHMSVIETFFNFNENQNMEEFIKSEEFNNFKKDFIKFMDICNSSSPRMFFDILRYFCIRRPKLQLVIKSLIQVVSDYSLKRYDRRFAQYIIDEYTKGDHIKGQTKEKDQIKQLSLIIFDDDYDELIKFLCQNPGFPINDEAQKYSNNKTPLELCCKYGSVKCFKYFYMNKCNITIEASRYAVEGGNGEIVQILAYSNVDFADALISSVIYHRYSLSDFIMMNYKCDHINSHTCLAAYHIKAFFFFSDEYMHKLNRPKEPRYFRDAPPIYFNKCNLPLKFITYSETMWGNNLSVAVCINGILPLLQYGILPFNKSRYREDNSPLLNFQELLDSAIDRGFLHIANFVLNLKFKQDSDDLKSLTYNCDDITSLACKQHYLPIIESFYSNDNNYGNTAILVACEYGCFNIVKYLVEKECNLESKNQDGETAFFIACKNGYINIVKYLISNHCSKGIRNQNGETALFAACQKGQIEVIKYLISEKCDTKTINREGKSLLHAAASSKNLEAVQYVLPLIEEKEKVDAFGCTPLHYACASGCLPIVEYLISNGFDKNVEDVFHNSPLKYAYLGHFPQVIEYLISIGCK